MTSSTVYKLRYNKENVFIGMEKTNTGLGKKTLGRTLCVLILLKLFIMFAVLRVFFFRPTLAGKTYEEKVEAVGTNLSTMNVNMTVSVDGGGQ